ncbi:hypothetical protein B0H65DRAFT_80507 [Neurospora tetraspora]|uniref:Uncharacterized protein n=1 Tax=Neurospora tetraspora TaxID=94610 RepID=A0AAE0J1B9_9PEZI|nr:hypothetical protein B0H65DRAFT_80507 [Neurospora tetraspora]
MVTTASIKLEEEEEKKRRKQTAKKKRTTRQEKNREKEESLSATAGGRAEEKKKRQANAYPISEAFISGSPERQKQTVRSRSSAEQSKSNSSVGDRVAAAAAPSVTKEWALAWPIFPHFIPISSFFRSLIARRRPQRARKKTALSHHSQSQFTSSIHTKAIPSIRSFLGTIHFRICTTTVQRLLTL